MSNDARGESHRLTAKEASDIYKPIWLKSHPKGKVEKVKLRDITPEDVFKQLSVQVFQGPFLENPYELLLIRERNVYQLASTFGGEFCSMVACDLNKDGSKDLAYSFSYGSGLTYGGIGLFDGKRNKVIHAKPRSWVKYQLTLDAQKNVIVDMFHFPKPEDVLNNKNVKPKKESFFLKYENGTLDLVPKQ